MPESLTDRATDERHMRHALALARRALGAAAPNPAVGCVLVKAGRVVGRGFTQPGGRPHAEAVALAQAATIAPEAARRSTAYVSFEPCSHHGVTAPCADALIAAGVERVVSAMEDPDPRVSGAGHARLAAAGIVVDQGLLAEEARQVNLGFVLAVTERQPLVAVKMATSLDGRIAAPGGDSRWITGPTARAAGHLARARYDAIAVGRGTAVADDPRLDCRLPGLAAASPLRVVLDSQARLDPALDLVAAATDRATILVCAENAPEDRVARLAGLGVTVLRCQVGDDGRIALPGRAAPACGAGGDAPAGRRRRHADRVPVACRPGRCRAVPPRARHDRGRRVPAVAGLGLTRVADAPRFVAEECVRLGDDMVESFRRRR